MDPGCFVLQTPSKSVGPMVLSGQKVSISYTSGQEDTRDLLTRCSLVVKGLIGATL